MGRGGRSLSPPLALSFSLCLPTIDDEKQRRRTLTTLRLSFSPAFFSFLLFLRLSFSLSFSSPFIYFTPSHCTVPWRDSSFDGHGGSFFPTAVPRRRIRIYSASLIQYSIPTTIIKFRREQQRYALRDALKCDARGASCASVCADDSYRALHAHTTLAIRGAAAVAAIRLWLGAARRDATRSEAKRRRHTFDEHDAADDDDGDGSVVLAACGSSRSSSSGGGSSGIVVV